MKKNYLNPLFRLMTVVLALLAGSFTASAADINVYGDVNLDGEVTVADVNSVIDVILNNDIIPTADVNSDGEINIADVNTLIDIILNGGIDPLLEACKKAVEVDQVVSNYCEQSHSYEELMSHSNEIEALDNVDYVFSNDNTTLYVAIKEFGTISYSYYPTTIQSNSINVKQQMPKQIKGMINSVSNVSHDHAIDQNDAKALLLFQMRKDESWSSYHPLLVSFFETAGIDIKVETSINIETFRYDLFNYDYITILTHGGYEFDSKKYEKDATYRGTHWLFTTEELPGNLIEWGMFLYHLRKQYDSQDVSVGYIEETRNGKAVMVPYLKVSDHFIESSENSFRHQGNAIVFNNACHSMQGPGIGIFEGDTINYNLARAFASKGAGLYIGYDQETSHSADGAIQFYSNLLSGMSVQGACNNLQNTILHDFKYNDSGTNSWWADFVPYFPSSTFENTCIIKPLIEVEDNSDENELIVNLSSTIPAGSLVFSYNYVFNEQTGKMEEYCDIDVMDLSDKIKYGFELSETEQFTDVARFGDKGVQLSEASNMKRITVSQNLKYNPSQSESHIKPNTTYWARVYIYDGYGYNYSEPVSFTTRSFISPIESIPVGNTGVTIEMVRVEGGTFMMGATQEQGDDIRDWEKPVHQVTLSTYRIGQTEVTQALWTAVMGSNPSSFTGNMNLPVESVNWEDCQLFITRLNQMTGRQFRLPTEAEWEFAARGGNKTNHYRYSGGNNADEVAWYPGNSNDVTHPVAQKKPNELGIYDMSGNVWEFCQDWYSRYSSNAQTNPTGGAEGSTPYRIIRGGSWFFPVEACRVAYRNICNPSNRNYSEGFRLAMDAD